MFNKRPETKIALAVLFIGWLTLGSPTASFAADHADAAGSKAAAASDARADRDDSGRNEAQAPPAAQPPAIWAQFELSAIPIQFSSMSHV